MLANSAARPRSAPIIVARRRPRRSTQAPAGSPNSRLGSHSSAVRYPICAAPTRSTITAASGSAMFEIWSPSIEIVDASQYRRNTRSRSSAGTSRDFMSAPPAPEVVREGQVQVADLTRPRRPQLRLDLALEVRPDQIAHLPAQFGQFLRGDVEDLVAEQERLLPLGWLARP